MSSQPPDACRAHGRSVRSIAVRRRSRRAPLTAGVASRDGPRRGLPHEHLLFLQR